MRCSIIRTGRPRGAARATRSGVALFDASPLSGQYLFYSITGADAAHVLSIASPMDTHNSVFPQNGASFTEAFGIEVLVLRSENEFEVAIDRSYGDMFNVHWLNTLGSSVLEKFQA